jgi:hypothetical protein
LIGQHRRSSLISPFSHCHRTRHPPRHLQQISLHIDDVVLSVPFAGEEVLPAIRLDPTGTVDKAVLVGAGVVPERVAVPGTDVRRVLKRAAAVGAGGLRQKPVLPGQKGGAPSRRTRHPRSPTPSIRPLAHHPDSPTRAAPPVRRRPTGQHLSAPARPPPDGQADREIPWDSSEFQLRLRRNLRCRWTNPPVFPQKM